MAASLTLTSVGPYSLKYLWAHDGAGSGTAAVTKAQMIADIAASSVNGPSPLKAVFEATTTDLAWAALDDSPQVSISTLVQSIVAGSNLAASFSTGPQSLVVVGVDANGGSGLVEIRFNHTFNR